ncbi:MAG TPA: class II fructose-bisphosphatase [Acetomicrobium flavidum]|uniref:Fructose-1,6-bisphosphatase n=2 Tax=Acetomicrobium TaxID=49894 RepID=I4BVI8_ACEMN|nr:class II fructose-bisphosphatase [Acetomicrobium mobile]NLG94715.1 class II fructose-bisphosphatase [Acetomicrobium flavidum]AFM21295.1 fructose-1,6-bisphosphatase, class II [Acetomicrobium mobile DSM 13181]SIN63726.1 fructose-1,6-bisphosphatase II [Acetomicrobium flavidum]HOJ81666.1 class II fructose-bisphosphatase [Acetomicrobium flavidum]HOM30708.1 class II fructose-bisphosphatase [Acetomicrobium flavidum]
MNVPDRNMALELVRATEAAAMSAGRWMGRGDKNAVDRAAVNAMRYMLNTVSMDGVVVIGEGEKDQAPMLFNGEKLGLGCEPKVDIAVDPVDGTTLTALGRPNAVSVVAVAESGTLYSPKHIFYMNKIATGPEAGDVIDIELSATENIKRVAKAKRKAVEDVTVVVLDRPRHEELIGEIRSLGARIKLIPDGDVAGALMTCKEDSGVDLLLGIGGSPEAVISACAIKCIGGNFQCKLWPRNEEERVRCLELGMDVDKVLYIDDLVRSDNVFFAATGVTDGELLKGVRYGGEAIFTHSLVMRSKSGTVRYVEAIHKSRKLYEISGVDYRTSQI